MSQMELEFAARGRECQGLQEKIKTSPVLVVGAGGIGCELLKTLVQTGFEKITVIDLDTIDVSNLNRQFLFRKKHVGQSKSLVACETVKAFSPNPNNIQITSYHGNVKEEQFDTTYFKQFTIVLNALDNVNARQHVNRMCLAADIPMVDAGTTGYLGQTVVIKKGETKCYDCEPKKETGQQKFPICTIRSTPDKPVHCIVWAKELFKLMFGNALESDLVDLDDNLSQANDPTDKKDHTKSLVMRAVERFDHPPNENELEAYCQRVFEAVFEEEIKEKLKMRDGYKGAKFKPSPLSYSQVAQDVNSGSGNLADGPRRVWSMAECLQGFRTAVKALWSEATYFNKIGNLTFDKDDDVIMRFVCASANLRSQVFGIERKSLFECKGIAGNIIHAIATTNAIVAGIQVREAVQLLINLLHSANHNQVITEQCQFVWVNRVPTGNGNLLQPMKLEEPIKKCVACGQAEVQLSMDLHTSTLGDVVNKVLKGRLGLVSPIVTAGNGSMIYECGDGLDKEDVTMYESNLSRLLSDCPGEKVREGTQFRVSDFFQSLEFTLVMHHRVLERDPATKEVLGELFILSGEPPVAATAEEEEASANEVEKEEDDDIVEVGNEESRPIHSVVKKMKMHQEKKKKEEEEDEEIMIIE